MLILSQLQIGKLALWTAKNAHCRSQVDFKPAFALSTPNGPNADLMLTSNWQMMLQQPKDQNANHKLT